jgi:S1-C subfamily serine protease
LKIKNTLVTALNKQKNCTEKNEMDLTQISDGMAAAVEKAAVSMVKVAGRRRGGATGIVWAEGLIVTADHVLPGGGHRGRHGKHGKHGGQDGKVRAPTVILADGTKLEAEVVGRDPSTDLALLKVVGATLTPATRSSETGKVGNLVMALGMGHGTTEATLGILSGIGASWRTGAGGVIDQYIQTDVLMYPGFSGGPLINTAGEMIGLNSSGLMRGASVAIPNSTIQRVVNQLSDFGEVKRGYLGIKNQPARLPEKLATELGQETGLLIAGVNPGSPAEESGLMVGDVIVKFNERPIRHPDDLLSELASTPPGQKSPATIVRGGKLKNLNVKVGAQEK